MQSWSSQNGHLAPQRYFLRPHPSGCFSSAPSPCLSPYEVQRSFQFQFQPQFLYQPQFQFQPQQCSLGGRKQLHSEGGASPAPSLLPLHAVLSLHAAEAGAQEWEEIHETLDSH